MSAKKEAKKELLESLVEEDCSNGRHAQKRIEGKLKKQGLCPKTIVEQLRMIRDVLKVG